MCLALYVTADGPLQIVPLRHYPAGLFNSPAWPREAQRFHTAELSADQYAVRGYFSHSNVLYAGSYEGCGCGFNFGRAFPLGDDDPEHLSAACESVAQLVRYVREFEVRELFCCWSGEESKTPVHRRNVAAEELASPDFYFREQELLTVNNSSSF